VVIHGDTIIGDNCNISQSLLGEIMELPSDYQNSNNVLLVGNVFFGNITIENHVTIGANLLQNIPDFHTVASPKMQ
jgi:serine O-acetyltransferase